MRKNLAQIGIRGPDGWSYIDDDWYDRGIPPNVHCAEDVYRSITLYDA